MSPPPTRKGTDVISMTDVRIRWSSAHATSLRCSKQERIMRWLAGYTTRKVITDSNNVKNVIGQDMSYDVFIF